MRLSFKTDPDINVDLNLIQKKVITDKRVMDTKNIYVVGRRVIDMFYAKGFSDVNIQFETGPTKGDGVIGVLMHAKIFAVKNGRPQEFETVVKCAPTCEVFRNSLPVRSLFLRETLYYTKIVPIYDNLQDQFELCVPQEMRCLLPKAYATCDESRHEMIVLEDLTKKGYTVAALKMLDYKHAAIILRIIAKLHALSFIYEDRYPKRFREMAHQYTDNIIRNTEEFDEKYLIVHGVKVMEQFTSVITDGSLKKRCVEALGVNAWEKFKEIHKSGKVMAILHGDNWHSNYMFKYKNGEPTEGIPIDFQWSRYGSIGYDFMYLFAFSVATDIRRNQFHQLVDEYYSGFKEFLTLCGYDANRFCSYDQFKGEVKSQSLISMVSFMIAYPLFTYPGFKLPDMISSTVYTASTEEYKQIVNDIVMDWANLGFI